MKNARELMLGYIEGTAEQSASLFAEADHLQCFFDVQLARTALRIAAVVIKHAIS